MDKIREGIYRAETARLQTELEQAQARVKPLYQRMKELRSLIGELHAEYIWGLSPCRESTRDCLHCRVNTVLMDREEYAEIMAALAEGDSDGSQG